MSYRRFADLLAPFADVAKSEERLIETDTRNLHLYGYGVKGFTLSMLESALEIAGDGLTAAKTQISSKSAAISCAIPSICWTGVARGSGPAFPSAASSCWSPRATSFISSFKLAASGLGDKFSGVEIVSEKTPEVYRRIFARLWRGALSAVMIGNSLRSDILPALEAGAFAVHIPHEYEWAHERAEDAGRR